MNIYRLSAFLLFLLISVQQAFAMSFYEERSGLLFSIPEGFTIRDASLEYKIPAGQSILSVETSTGKDVFEISITTATLTSVLEQTQLRSINTLQLTNREILGITGVELVGQSFGGDEPRRAFLFSDKELTISILYLGTQIAEYDQFLEKIQKTTGFVDAISHPLQSEIDLTAELNIFSGYKEGNSLLFRPEQTINRAEFLKVLVLSQPGNTEESIQRFFVSFKADEKNKGALQDVDREAWFAPFIFYAYEKGWVKGYPDGTFRPGNTLNIAEAVKIFLEARGLNLPQNSEEWFRPYLEFFTESAIISEEADRFRFTFTDSVFFPFSPCTRAQAAGFISRLLFLDEHPGVDVFGRLIPAEGIDFTFENLAALEVLEIGTGLAEKSYKAYSLYQKKGATRQSVVQILAYYPEDWTELERMGVLGSLNLAYMGENASAIYAVRSICERDESCVAGIRAWFSMKNQDFEVFEDLNFHYRFLHQSGLQFEKIVEPQLETVLVKDGIQQKAIFSFFQNQGTPFDDQTPVYQAVIGNKEWKVFKENLKGVPRLSLVASFKTGGMVISIPYAETFSRIDPKIIRMIRTLEVW